MPARCGFGYPQAHLADFAGILQADAYGGYNKLYEADRKPGAIVEAGCWAHARRPFFALADLAENARRRAQGRTTSVISPLALEALRRIHALFEIERAINGKSSERRRAVRQELSAPLIAELEGWLREQRAKLSRGNDLAKAMDYLLKRWSAFARFLDDGRVCLSNNAAERCAVSRCGVHCTPLPQVSGNIGSWFSKLMRHGRPVRPIAAMTRSSWRSEARIW